MSTLPWITDKDLDACIAELLKRIGTPHTNVSKRVKNNVPDPFWLLCIANRYQVANLENLLDIQLASSVSTSVASAVGNFHQSILGKVPGFTNHDSGYDIESTERKILAEIKNKHNTMNSDNRKAVVNKLETVLSTRPGYTGYLVIIVPKKKSRYKTKLRKNLYEVDGATFYEIVTGHKNALQEVHKVLAKRLCSDVVAEHVVEKYLESLPE